MRLAQPVLKPVLVLFLTIFCLSHSGCQKNIQEPSTQQSNPTSITQTATANELPASNPNTTLIENNSLYSEIPDSVLNKHTLLNTPAYSADVVLVVNNTSAPWLININVDKNKARIEMTNGEQPAIYIFNKDTKKEYAFMPNAIKGVIFSEEVREQMLLHVGGTKHEFMGEETINGKTYKKYKMLKIVLRGNTKVIKDMFLLTDKENNIPYKLTFAEDPIYYEWKNVKVGSQKPELFIPSKQ